MRLKDHEALSIASISKNYRNYGTLTRWCGSHGPSNCNQCWQVLHFSIPLPAAQLPHSTLAYVYNIHEWASFKGLINSFQHLFRFQASSTKSEADWLHCSTCRKWKPQNALSTSELKNHCWLKIKNLKGPSYLHVCVCVHVHTHMYTFVSKCIEKVWKYSHQMYINMLMVTH